MKSLPATLTVVMLALLPAPAHAAETNDAPPPVSDSATARMRSWLETSRGAAPRVEPLNIPPNARCFRQVERERAAWWERVLFAPARERLAARKEPWAAEAQKFLDDTVIELISERLRFDPIELNETGRKLVAAGCDDPAVLYCSAALDADCKYDWRYLHDNMQKVVAAWEKDSSVPAAMRLKAMWSLKSALMNGGHKTDDIHRRMINLLPSVMSDSSYAPDEMELLVRQWAGMHFFHKEHGAKLREIFEQAPIPEWAKLTLIGDWEIDEAWAHRGNGWANEVTPEGWQGFGEHLAKAREALTRAWELNPKCPLAPERMITVAMAGAAVEGETVRTWFDRTIAAQCDYTPAYNSILSAYLPRWSGSYELMVAFGRACVDTKRWDTDIPLAFTKACNDIVSEITEWRQFYGRAEVAGPLMQLSEALLKEPTRAHERSMRLSYLAVNAWLTADYARASKALAELNGPLHPACHSKLRGHQVTEPEMRDDIAIRSSPFAEQAAKAASLFDTGDVAGAEAIYREIEPKAEGTAAEALRQRLALAVIEQKLAAGEWVQLAASPGLAGWVVRYGDWAGTPEGTLINRGNDKAGMIYHRARIGADFELKVEFAVEAKENCCQQCTLFFGWHPGDSEWSSAYLARASRGPLRARIYQPGDEKPIADAMPKLEKVNRFVLRSEGGRLNYTVNGQKVASDLEIDPRPLATDGVIGFSSNRWCRMNTTRITKIEVRRLTR